MSTDPVMGVHRLGPPPWPTLDPFLFCVHHHDAYPAGTEAMTPAASLEGRTLGQDFAGKDGWRMYHGRQIPGFPQHPHRGFETLTVMRKGVVDHSDSLGATARFGDGDAQWMTAGQGIVHAEMFPMIHQGAPNPLELFQIWINLPAADKMAPPHFSMLWRESIPVHSSRDAAGRRTDVTVIAGTLGAAVPPSPPPRSWASRPDADVAVWTIHLEPGATWTMPPARPGTARVLYAYEGGGVHVGGHLAAPPSAVQVKGDASVELRNGDAPSGLLLLQGRPIGEPVSSHGPFVMNTREEIETAFRDYQRTRFGGWPWPDDAPVHSRDAGRFAKHADGRVERQG